MYKPNFNIGDVIEFCGERFRVVTTGETMGTVEYLDGEYLGRMYWEYGGEKAVLVEHKSK